MGVLKEKFDDGIDKGWRNTNNPAILAISHQQVQLKSIESTKSKLHPSNTTILLRIYEAARSMSPVGLRREPSAAGHHTVWPRSRRPSPPNSSSTPRPIKTHCQVGYEIVAGMTFGLSMVEIVLQHHGPFREGRLSLSSDRAADTGSEPLDTGDTACSSSPVETRP